MQGRSLAYVLSRSLEQRDMAVLLLLPLFLLAFALAMSQSWRNPIRTAIEAPATRNVAVTPQDAQREGTRAPAMVSPPPAVAISPRMAPAAPGPEIELVAPPFVLSPSPPVVEVPQVELATPAPRMPAKAPPVDIPEVIVAAPLPGLPLVAPQIPVPEIAIAPSHLMLPASPPVVPPPVAAEVAAVPVTSQGQEPAAAPRMSEPLAALRLPEPEPSPEPLQHKAGLAPVPPAAATEAPAPSGPMACPATPDFGRPAYAVRVVAPGEDFGERLAAAAREQTKEFVVYNDAYKRIAYPMGDVHPMYGVCTDVIIRAYRALGVDLQELIAKARVGSGDTSIQHRRVDTMRKFFAAKGASLPVTTFAENFRPGDVVSYHRPQNAHSRTHIAIVSDVVAPSGRLMIVHNRGWGPQLEDALFVDKITGHYRFHPAAPAPAVAKAAPAAPAAAALPPGMTSPPHPQKRPAASAVTRTVVKAAYAPAAKARTTTGQATRNGLPNGPQ